MEGPLRWRASGHIGCTAILGAGTESVGMFGSAFSPADVGTPVAGMRLSVRAPSCQQSVTLASVQTAHIHQVEGLNRSAWSDLGQIVRSSAHPTEGRHMDWGTIQRPGILMSCTQGPYAVP